MPCLACHQHHQSPPRRRRCPLRNWTPGKLSLLASFIDIRSPCCISLLISPFSLLLTSSAPTFTSYRHSHTLVPYATHRLYHSLRPLTLEFSSTFIRTAARHVASLTYI